MHFDAWCEFHVDHDACWCSPAPSPALQMNQSQLTQLISNFGSSQDDGNCKLLPDCVQGEHGLVLTDLGRRQVSPPSMLRGRRAGIKTVGLLGSHTLPPSFLWRNYTDKKYKLLITLCVWLVVHAWNESRLLIEVAWDRLQKWLIGAASPGWHKDKTLWHCVCVCVALCTDHKWAAQVWNPLPGRPRAAAHQELWERPAGQAALQHLFSAQRVGECCAARLH